MSINSEIRKIAKAWGVDTKGSSIKDALKDLRTNLPFSTKTEMVEIVPEQSATGELNSSVNLYITSILIDGETGKTYTVKINDTTYQTVCTEQGFIGNSALLGVGEDTGEPFVYIEGGFSWKPEVGETITLQIVGLKTTYYPIVPQLSTKMFYIMPEGTGDEAEMYIYTDKFCTQKATKNDLLSNYNCVFEEYSGGLLSYKLPVKIGEHIDDSAYAVIMGYYANMNGYNLFSCREVYTAEREYESNGGGGTPT